MEGEENSTGKEHAVVPERVTPLTYLRMQATLHVVTNSTTLQQLCMLVISQWCQSLENAPETTTIGFGTQRMSFAIIHSTQTQLFSVHIYIAFLNSSTTHGNANQSGISSPARSICRNLVPDNFKIFSPAALASSLGIYPRSTV